MTRYFGKSLAFNIKLLSVDVQCSQLFKFDVALFVFQLFAMLLTRSVLIIVFFYQVSTVQPKDVTVAAVNKTKVDDSVVKGDNVTVTNTTSHGLKNTTIANNSTSNKTITGNTTVSTHRNNTNITSHGLKNTTIANNSTSNKPITGNTTVSTHRNNTNTTSHGLKNTTIANNSTSNKPITGNTTVRTHRNNTNTASHGLKNTTINTVLQHSNTTVDGLKNTTVNTVLQHSNTTVDELKHTTNNTVLQHSNTTVVPIHSGPDIKNNFTFIPRIIKLSLKTKKSKYKYKHAYFQYRKEFSKKYNKHELKKRYKIFKNNVKALEKSETEGKHKKHTIVLTLDYFTDLTDTEKKNYIEKKKSLSLSKNGTGTVMGREEKIYTQSLDPFSGI